MNRHFQFPSVPVQGLVLILGLGLSGIASARWCAAQGARLRLVDTRNQPEGIEQLRKDLPEVQICLGADSLIAERLDDVSLVVLSPGLNPRQEQVAALLRAADEHQIEVVGEIELFARALADMAGQGYEPKLIAVSGTNGKTTVTELSAHLAQACGVNARAAGNIGPPALACLLTALAADDLPELWVLELSSFQLVSTSSLQPDAAVILNLSQDHLDWHGSLTAYAAAKQRLLQMARVALVNRDDGLVSAMVPDLAAGDVRSFGAQAPVYAGDFGLVEQQGIAWLALAQEQQPDTPEKQRTRKKTAVQSMNARQPGQLQLLMPAEALLIRGQHNALNALAALVLGQQVGLPLDVMLHALRTYRGLAHRTQFVRTIAGVDFFNDSKATNVGATVAALHGIGQRVVLIAGGLGKGQDFRPLADAIYSHARALVFMGQDGALIAQHLDQGRLPCLMADSLTAAVRLAHAQAQAGDAVLLSPACASMDMFRDYVQRGQQFIAAVNELALELGEVA